MDILFEAGAFAEENPINSISDNIMFGQPVPIGTGKPYLLMDKAYLEKTLAPPAPAMASMRSLSVIRTHYSEYANTADTEAIGRRKRRRIEESTNYQDPPPPLAIATSPSYAPTSPSYIPDSPVNVPTTEYVPTSPSYIPDSPVYVPTSEYSAYTTLPENDVLCTPGDSYVENSYECTGYADGKPNQAPSVATYTTPYCAPGETKLGSVAYSIDPLLVNRTSLRAILAHPTPLGDITRYSYYKPSSPSIPKQLRYTSYHPSSPRFENQPDNFYVQTISETVDSIVNHLLVEDIPLSFATNDEVLYEENTGQLQVGALHSLAKKVFENAKRISNP